jgi:hypothetical protein
MKTLLALALLPTLALAAPYRPAPDLPPDATTGMLKAAGGAKLLTASEDGLDSIVKVGERNLAWLSHINSLRPANDKISLTSKETMHGIPIDQPSEYNVNLIQKKLETLKPTIPAPMQDVLFGAQAFPDSPNVPLKDYINSARELDRVYQLALRWRMMLPYLDYLTERRHQDVRGWYFLSKLDGRAEKLKNFSQQDSKLQAQLREWLTGLCFNSEGNDDISECETAVESMIKNGQDLEAYYQSLAPDSQKVYESFFLIPDQVQRAEITEVAGDHPHLEVPFTDPVKDEVRHFLQDNVQDEWRIGDWHLDVSFSNAPGLAHIEFQSGATPHVNQVGGDTIVMNANQPLTEYDANWTIRHEFGHVLGFLDCYVEFYKREQNVIVSYQFDTDNLMCSRRGHIQERHRAELERIYTK